MSRLARAAGVLAATAALLAVAPALAPSALAATGTQPPAGAFGLGDSVMAGARHELAARGFTRVDAATSRQSYVGPSRIRRAGAALPQAVVIHLGTNGSYPLDVCRRMVDLAGASRQVFLVTVHAPVRWKRADNDVIRRCASSYDDGHVHVVDWDAAASAHPAWLYADHTHLRPVGARAYADLLATAVTSTRH